MKGVSSYQVVLQGVAEGVEPGDAARRLAALMKQPVALMQSILSEGRQPVVKKGVTHDQALQYIKALEERAGCRAVMVLESGTVEAAQPPPGPPAVAPGPAAAAAIAAIEAELAAQRDYPRLFEIAEGIRLLCISVALNFVSRKPLELLPPLLSLLCFCIIAALQVFGCHRLAVALGFSRFARTVVHATSLSILPAVAIAAFGNPVLLLPAGLANLLLILFLGISGNRALKKAGFRTGLFGASKADTRALGNLDEGENPGSSKLGWAAAGLCLLIFVASPKLKGDDVELAVERPCSFVGQWEARDAGDEPVFAIRLDADGNYTARRAADGDQPTRGTWHIRDGHLHLRPVAMVDIVNKVDMAADGQGFNLTVRPGEVISLDLVERLPAAGCMSKN